MPVEDLISYRHGEYRQAHFFEGESPISGAPHFSGVPLRPHSSHIGPFRKPFSSECRNANYPLFPRQTAAVTLSKSQQRHAFGWQTWTGLKVTHSDSGDYFDLFPVSPSRSKSSVCRIRIFSRPFPNANVIPLLLIFTIDLSSLTANPLCTKRR